VAPSSFAGDPLLRRLAVRQQALDALFDAHPHVVGVVLTSGEQRLGGPAVDADHAGCQGVALKRTMPDVLVRDSTVAVVGSPLRDSARW
jgi:hypothetical protein